MKKVILAFLILLPSFAANCQKYTPFNFENGEWVMYYFTRDGVFLQSNMTTLGIVEKVKFFCKGDTMINGIIYNKLFYSGYAEISFNSKTNISGYYGAIRNDTAEKKVWLFESYFGFRQVNPSVLYDFNLKLGSSFLFDFLDTVTVSSIDSVLYCSKYHRRYNFESAELGPSDITEGIGSVEGLIPVQCCGFIPLSSFVCYSEKNSAYCDSCITPSTEISNNDIKKISIFPNPSSEEVQIFSEPPLTSIEVFDISGKLVYSNFRINSAEVRFELKIKGSYVARLKTLDKILVRKIIIK